MRVYKSSGIEWLGEIPHHWEVRRLKYLVKRIIGGGTPDTSNLQYWANDENEGYLWVSIEDITNADFITDTKRYINQSGLANSSAKLLPPFSILYSIYASLGKIAYSNKILATNQAILGIQPNELLFYKFLFYYLQNTTNHIISFSNTTTQNNISLFIVANHKIPLPPLQEQKEIAEFLDKKCEKIQNYINKKQKLITFLQEKKQALINEAVTKGLNPNIEFKNSGIEYLGLIPHHWEAVKVKYVATTNIGLVYDPSEITTNENIGYPVLRANNIQNGKIDYKDVIYVAKKIDDKQLAISGDLLMCVRNGSENLLGKTAKIEDNNFSFGAFTAIIRSDFNNYLYWIFQTEMLKKSISSFIVSIGIGQISQDDIKNFKIPLPPLQEQKEIAEFLDKKCEKINSAIEKTKKQIELVREYKNTLINEAVCGRIKLKEVK
ncbi:restriction endonuclease subunit S [Campylobacter upsaliensis]|uniref:restriction endonuclease subunit S n=1 Tax=Campylobacter upsaliensis TaxID=28080 RepID=UPI00214A1ED5|nr:restriction endonuclease subunit S [Campylobacter upsaliensis]MCR2111637.1 restriction endonuclease subunit S [Campylobacter upsaliensis]